MIPASPTAGCSSSNPSSPACSSRPRRDISTLSPTLRSAWDGRPLAILTRTAPARATSAHIAIIGHITATELRHHVTPVELANGLLNRFLYRLPLASGCYPTAATPTRSQGTGLDRHLARVLTPRRPPGSSASIRHAASSGTTPTRNSPHPATGSPAISPRAPKRTRSASRSSTRSLDGASARSRPSTSTPRSRSRTTPPAQPPGRSNQRTGDPLAEQIHAALVRSPDGLTRTQLRDLCNATSPPGASNRRSPTSPPPAAPNASGRSPPAAPPSSGPPPDPAADTRPRRPGPTPPTSGAGTSLSTRSA